MNLENGHTNQVRRIKVIDTNGVCLSKSKRPRRLAEGKPPQSGDLYRGYCRRCSRQQNFRFVVQKEGLNHLIVGVIVTGSRHQINEEKLLSL